MLSKLLKYEFKATGRMFLPLYGAVLIFALLGRFSLSFSLQRDFGSIGASFPDQGLSLARLGEIFLSLVMMAYVLAILAAFVITAVIIIQRFWKNLMGDEGYLMFTLPVSADSLLWSKAIVAFVWNLATGLVVLLSVGVLLLQPQMISESLKAWRENQYEIAQVMGMLRAMFGNIWPLWLAALFISGLGSIFSLYAAMAIGHTAHNHKVLASLGAFLGLGMASSFLVSTLSTALLPLFTRNIESLNRMSEATFEEAFQAVGQIMSATMLFGVASSVVIAVGMYFVTRYLLTSQLNLE